MASAASRLAQRARALVERVLGDEAALGELVAAIEIGARIVERRGVALRLRLRLVERGLEVARVDPVEQVALLDVRAVGRGLRVQIAGDASPAT